MRYFIVSKSHREKQLDAHLLEYIPQKGKSSEGKDESSEGGAGVKDPLHIRLKTK